MTVIEEPKIISEASPERRRPVKEFKRRLIGVPAVRSAYNYREVRGRMKNETNPYLQFLNASHGARALMDMEGYISPDQSTWLRDRVQILAGRGEVRHIAQTGFNAGHSAALFLGCHPEINLTSFDIGEHSYVDNAQAFIEDMFPGRHELVRGDSTKILPDHKAGQPYDMVFVDGGHSFEVAYADLRNLQGLSKPEGLVIMDDYLPGVSYGEGPVAAWRTMLDEGRIQEIEKVSDKNRAWVVGRHKQKTP